MFPCIRTLTRLLTYLCNVLVCSFRATFTFCLSLFSLASVTDCWLIFVYLPIYLSRWVYGTRVMLTGPRRWSCSTSCRQSSPPCPTTWRTWRTKQSCSVTHIYNSNSDQNRQISSQYHGDSDSAASEERIKAITIKRNIVQQQTVFMSLHRRLPQTPSHCRSSSGIFDWIKLCLMTKAWRCWRNCKTASSC